MNFKNDDQFRSFMKKEASRLGISTQNAYNTFFSRYILSKLSELNHGELFVKGSFVEFIHAKELNRPITDLDIASLLNKDDAMVFLLSNLYDSNSDFWFELSKLPKISSTGINQFNFLCNYRKIIHPLNVDLEPEYSRLMELNYKRVPSIFENDEDFYINCPSYEEYLAEKLSIVLEYNKPNKYNPAVINSRVKDFYDIYKMHNGKFDLDKLNYYLGLMIEKRKRIDKNDIKISHLNEDFIISHQDLWNRAKVKYEFLDDSVDFNDAVLYTKAILNVNIKKLTTKNYFIK